MKKFIFALILCLIWGCWYNVYAYEARFAGEDILWQITEAYNDSNPRKMQKLWKEFCEIQPEYSRFVNAYNNALSRAKANRKLINKQRWMSIAAGAAAGLSVANSNNLNNNRTCIDGYGMTTCTDGTIYNKTFTQVQREQLELRALQQAARPKNYVIYNGYNRPIATIQQRNW